MGGLGQGQETTYLPPEAARLKGEVNNFYADLDNI